MSVKMLFFNFRQAERSFFKDKRNYEGFDIEFFEENLDEDSVEHLSEEFLEETAIVSVFITSNVTKKVLEKFKNLLIVATRSTGYDHIDIASCSERNIKVINVANYGKNSVVQYCFSAMILLLRNFIQVVRDNAVYKFEPNEYVGRELNNLTIGIIGTGAIGSEMCRIANAFGMKILAYDIAAKQNLIDDYNVEYTYLETLLENSDVISLHIPYHKKMHYFISKKEFSVMKSNTILINTSRGELVDTEALYKAILNKNIGGAALDVSECEEINFNSQKFINYLVTSSKECLAKVLITRKLLQLPNIMITSHIGYSTNEAINRILNYNFNSIRDCVKGGHDGQVN